MWGAGLADGARALIAAARPVFLGLVEDGNDQREFHRCSMRRITYSKRLEGGSLRSPGPGVGPKTGVGGGKLGVESGGWGGKAGVGGGGDRGGGVGGWGCVARFARQATRFRPRRLWFAIRAE